jgi:hypothetical protein
MARADYRAQMERHAGEWDVLPNGLAVPSLPHGSDWRRGNCRGVALLTDEVLQGNRWPAVSGALLAELARRCAVLGALTVLDPSRWPRPRDLSVRFRKAIGVADARRRPTVADGNAVLYWNASLIDFAAGDAIGADLGVAVRMARRPGQIADEDATLEARLRFEVEAAPGDEAAATVERRMSDYLLRLPRRLALPAYLAGWSDEEIHGVCRERPGSLLAVAEQALADAGKIVRGDGVPEGEEESMLLADLTYHWLEPIDDARVTYVARPGSRRRDEKGRDWVTAVATLSVDGRPVGEASGNLVLRRS